MPKKRQKLPKSISKTKSASHHNNLVLSPTHRTWLYSKEASAAVFTDMNATSLTEKPRF